VAREHDAQPTEDATFMDDGGHSIEDRRRTVRAATAATQPGAVGRVGAVL
jgi:hypothetical protein